MMINCLVGIEPIINKVVVDLIKWVHVNSGVIQLVPDLELYLWLNSAR